jgi:glyoxylase-like metal-dependent hydrolase (beta-lactamase superfamily II)
MTFKEFIRFTYGLFMGTSTPLLKPSQRYLFPLKLIVFDEQLRILLGGSGICALLRDQGTALLVNTNQAGAARAVRKWFDEKPLPLKIALTSVETDFSGGVGLFPEAEKIFMSQGDERENRKLINIEVERVSVLQSETVIEVAGEKVRLIPLGAVATGSDLAIYFESRSILFVGALFYNRIHPILHPGASGRIDQWMQCLSSLLDRFQPRVVVPAEGEIGNAEDARLFVSYLRDLTDPRVEFSKCREKYDWLEIPSHTSLEENFDLLREHKRTFTTLN